ncbi:universal stress protein [Synechococcales cyanobacterium C]|uniref:Universal stress protein n=1 Tax=Petrachloros mirabilis ULC683 TaxID=2781853 RepID=A0A8K2A8J3_9CYAN|nr:cation:proton antiporter [Petrachloros mirabilis]NCJ08091.1 universal stress protein [Petrachloros mirabilis ULC683]
MIFGNFWTSGWEAFQSFWSPFLLSEPITDPVPVFLIIMAIMLVAPLLFERIRLPGIVGLILAGVVVGPNGLGLLERDSTIVLLGTVGLLFLMFMAGLETSLDDLKLNADKAVIFGIATFAVPMIVGIIAIQMLGYSLLAAILVASCFASHTLVALPIISKRGLMRTQVVTATLGGTLITNVLALLVLAVVVKAHQGDLDLGFWLFLIPSLSIYTFATLWGVPRIGRWFFRRFGHDEGAEFTFVVATLFVVSFVADLIEIEPIIGAFLAGIAITQLIPQMSPLMNRIQFIGNTLFVPFFLISVGMLVNPLILIQEPQSLLVSGVMVGAALGTKLIPAWGVGRLFGFGRNQTMVMFGLSVAQAASTLAAITVAFNIELVDQLTVNGTIVMILVTCIASPWVTERWGGKMDLIQSRAPQSQPLAKEASAPVANMPQRVLVPIANPSTEDNLLQLALILVKATQGTLLPLHVLVEGQDPVSAEAKMQQDRLLQTAEHIANAAVVAVEPIGRIDDAVEKGILRTAQEHRASLIICGWKGYSTYRENFFGNVIDIVMRRATVPVFITRFKQPINTIERVVVAIADTPLSPRMLQPTLELTQKLAGELKATPQIFLMSPKPQPRNESLVSRHSGEMALQRVRGTLASGVNKRLGADDLLILIAAVNASLPGVPTLGVEEAIARANPNLSMIIAHFPS